MKQLKFIPLVGILLFSFFAVFSCKEKAKNLSLNETDSIDNGLETDSTLYGICGEGTGMHNLQLITDSGDSIDCMLMDDCEQANMGLRGGLLVGDRMAVIGRNVDGEFQAIEVLNLTTLLGRWNSIDKDFEIEEGGAIQTYQPVEKNDWKVWKIFNGKLLLGRDSFQVNTLGPDSLVLENKQGIFVYKRKENKKQ